ncbi:MAG: CNNM domain-containing protein, partial [Candidatus Fervidibacter sp.]|uniref:CNNM domain-containing protein n=1 Tax=Candidatus Fervidibacter sp. TaxID=3100871 RepID=UPI0040490810
MSSDNAAIAALKITLVVLLLWISSLFSASETALLGSGKIKAKHLADEGEENAKRVLSLYLNPPRLIVTLIAGITISDYIAQALITSLALDLGKAAQVVWLSGIIPIVFALLVLVFIDVTPAIYGAAYADVVAFTVARWISLFQKLLSPLLTFVESMVNGVLLLLGFKDAYHPPLVTESEIFESLNIAEQQGVITKEQKQMLSSALEFKEVRVGEVMVPRVDIVAVRHDTLLDEAMQVMRRSGHSRLPAYYDTKDEIVGILHAKDILAAWYKGERNKTASELARPPLFDTESQ